MSINVNVFWELVSLVPFLQTEFGAEIDIIKRFPRRNRQILTEWHVIASMLWVILGLFMYAVTS
jgi:hypothetical protein